MSKTQKTLKHWPKLVRLGMYEVPRRGHRPLQNTSKRAQRHCMYTYQSIARHQAFRTSLERVVCRKVGHTTTLTFHIDPFINYDTALFNVPQKLKLYQCEAKDTGFRRLAPRRSSPKRSGEQMLKIDDTTGKKTQNGQG